MLIVVASSWLMATIWGMPHIVAINQHIGEIMVKLNIFFLMQFLCSIKIKLPIATTCFNEQTNSGYVSHYNNLDIQLCTMWKLT